MSSGKVILGLVAGLAAGALLGVLFAPDKGTETRKKIIKKGEDYADAMTEKFNAFIDSLSEKFDDLKEEAGKVKHKTETDKKDVKSATV